MGVEMIRVAKYVGIALVVLLAVYGAVKLVVGSLTESQGREAVEKVNPFVRGAASAAKEQIKQSLEQTPNEQLEKDAAVFSRKLYPVLKGALLGQIEAFVEDPKRSELPEKMHQAGKQVGKQVVVPFTQGLAEGSNPVVGQVDKTLDSLSKFREDHKEFFDALSAGVSALGKTIKEGAPPSIPAPGTPQGPPGNYQSPPYPQGAPMTPPSR